MDSNTAFSFHHRPALGAVALTATGALLMLLLWPSTAAATSCTPECACPVWGSEPMQELVLPADGTGGVPPNARLLIVSGSLDASAITLEEADAGVPVEYVLEPDLTTTPPLVWVVPRNGFDPGVSYRLAMAGVPELTSVFTAGDQVDNVPPTHRTEPTEGLPAPPPCDESLYLGVLSEGEDDREVALVGLTVTGGNLPAPQRYFVTPRFGGEGDFLIGRSIDGEQCLHNFILAEQGTTYQLSITHYDLAGNASEPSAPVAVAPTYKAASPEGHRTCVAGCCVSSLSRGPGNWPGALLFIALVGAFLLVRRRLT